VRKVVASLVDELGASKAIKRARFERQRARRARSRKQFAFWAAVEHTLKVCRSIGDANLLGNERSSPKSGDETTTQREEHVS